VTEKNKELREETEEAAEESESTAEQPEYTGEQQAAEQAEAPAAEEEPKEAEMEQEMEQQQDYLAQLEQLEEEKARLVQQLLRLKADFENYRRRMNQQLESIRLEANEQLIKDLLPVLDNFERAMQAKDEDQVDDPFFQGMEMIHRGLHEVLASHGLKPIEAVGQPFDPNLHEAVAMQGEGGAKLSVLAQVQTGYLLHDKVLRHTKVLVGQSEEEEQACQK